MRREALELAAAVGVGALTDSELAAAAHLSQRGLRRHGPGSVAGFVAASYSESSAGLQCDFELALLGARRWADGLHWATEGLVKTLIVDPPRARFGYVEVLNGGDRLRALREETRRRSIEIFVRGRYGNSAADRGQRTGAELACNVIIHAIATHAREGRIDELPRALDAVLVAAGAD